MSESMDDVKREIALTREEISVTVVELEEAVAARVDDATRRASPMRVVREHPWPALAIAFGAGVLVSATGADTRAAQATTHAARRAPRIVRNASERTAQAARGAAQKVSSRMRRAASQNTAADQSSGPGLMDRVTDALAAPLVSRFDQLLDLLRDGSRDLATAMRSGSASRPMADAMPNTIVATERRDRTTGGASIVELPPDTEAGTIPVPPEMTPPELGARAEAVEEQGEGTHEPPLEPGAGQLGSKWA